MNERNELNKKLVIEKALPTQRKSSSTIPILIILLIIIILIVSFIYLELNNITDFTKLI